MSEAFETWPRTIWFRTVTATATAIDKQVLQPPSMYNKILNRKFECCREGDYGHGLEEEIEDLFRYYKEVLEMKVEGLELDGCGSE